MVSRKIFLHIMHISCIYHAYHAYHAPVFRKLEIQAYTYAIEKCCIFVCLGNPEQETLMTGIFLFV